MKSMVNVIVAVVALVVGSAVGIGALSGSSTSVVAQNGSGDHTTIADGVAAADDGDTVVVKPGTYSESVTSRSSCGGRSDSGTCSRLMRMRVQVVERPRIESTRTSGGSSLAAA